MHGDVDDLNDDLLVIHGYDVDFLSFDDHSNDDLILKLLIFLFCLLMMGDIVDLLDLVEVELYAVDDSAEEVQDVVEAAHFVVDLLLLDDVDDHIDAETESMVLGPDG